MISVDSGGKDNLRLSDSWPWDDWMGGSWPRVSEVVKGSPRRMDLGLIDLHMEGQLATLGGGISEALGQNIRSTVGRESDIQ